MKKEILIATGNSDKVREISEILSEYSVKSIKDLDFKIDIVESGTSFFENALIKAKALYNATGIPVVADDSGICVSALFGAPGIYSARYSGTGDNIENNKKLLSELSDKADRRAEYVCTAVYYDGKRIIVERGTMKGEILKESAGTGGFGYDPIFYSYDLKKSVGCCTDREKNTVSHRAKAFTRLKKRLEGEKLL